MMKYAWAVAAVALVPAIASAQEVIPGPAVLTQNEGNWAYSGIGFTALQDVSLVSFTFSNQGLSDNILLLDASWNPLYSIGTPAGAPIHTSAVNWDLNAGDSYWLVRTTTSNSKYDFYEQALPSNDHLAITNSGFFTTALGDPGYWSTNQWWSSFTNVTTVASVAPVPEPSTWAMMLLGFGAIGFSVRRRRKENRLPSTV